MSLRDFVMGATSFLWQAFVFAKLWGWYMVPLFHLPTMGVVGGNWSLPNRKRLMSPV